MLTWLKLWCKYNKRLNTVKVLKQKWKFATTVPSIGIMRVSIAAVMWWEVPWFGETDLTLKTNIHMTHNVCWKHQCSCPQSVDCCPLQLREAGHGELTSESFHLSLDLCHPLLELLFLSQCLDELLKRGLGIQASLHLQGQLNACRGKAESLRTWIYCLFLNVGFKSLPWWMNPATFLKSSCSMPLEVRAGEPNLRPLGRKALLSPKQKEKLRMALCTLGKKDIYSF